MEDAEVDQEQTDSVPDGEDRRKSVHRALSYDSDFNDLSSLSSYSDDDVCESSSDEDCQSGSNSEGPMPSSNISNLDRAQLDKPENTLPLHYLPKDKSAKALGLTTYNDVKPVTEPMPQKKKLVITDSIENGIDAEETPVAQPAAKVASRKSKSMFKRIGRFFFQGPTHQDAKPIETIHGIVPGTKATITDGERGEQWNFNEGTFCRANVQSIEKPKPSTTKKVLKLQLSEVQDELSPKPSDSATGKEGSNSDSEEGNIANPHTGALRQAFERCTTDNLNFMLCDSDKHQCLEWQKAFEETDGVKIIQGTVFEHHHECDAVVIPGNSFGFLDGEPEIKFTEAYGWHLQEDILHTIREEYDGELLVGQAIVTPIEAPGSTVTSRAQSDCQSNHPRYAIYAPIMRVPLHVGDSPNAYLAFRAAILAVRRHNKIQDGEKISTVLCPSLCNGFGGMPPGRITSQMKAAYDAFVTQERTDLAKPTGLGPMATCHVHMTTKIGNWC